MMEPNSPTDIEHATIESESLSVVQAFETLRDVATSPQDLTILDAADVEDQFGRFNLFASNVGVFAQGHASLDYRLSENEEARSLTLLIVQHLQRLLRTADKQVLHVEETTLGSGLGASVAHAGADDKCSTSLDSYVTSEASAASTTDTYVSHDGPESDRVLTRIEEAIDRLYRLSWIIRKPSQASQNAKAAHFKYEEESDFEEYATKVVRIRFPSAQPDLVRLVAWFITLRRKRFLYRRNHQSKLAAIPEKRSHIKLDEHATPAPSTVVPATHRDVDGRQNFTQKARKPGAAPISTTTASRFARSDFPAGDVLNARSALSTIVDHSDSRIDGLTVPSPPKLAPGAKEFQCSFCCMIIPIKEAKPLQWKQHFLKDLDPYFCLFPDCNEPQRMFSDIATWLGHMERNHTRQWCCRLKGHEIATFPSEHEYDAHMFSSHAGGFTERHLPMLRHSAEIPGGAFTSCPFCHDDPQVTAAKEGPTDELAHHVAEHMRSLAIMSLPLEEAENDEGSQRSISRDANESSKDSNHDDLPQLPNEEDGETFPEYELDTQPDVTTIATASVSMYQQEWGFLKSLAYQGHDRDPILQKFLRKLYLESSPSSCNLAKTKGPILPMTLVPFERNENFFGQEHALDKAAASLVPSLRARRPHVAENLTNPVSYAIFGAGGMGKTQVALEFVHQYRESFDVVLWANADDASKLAQDFNSIALELGLIPRDSIDATDQIQTKEIVKRWLVEPLKDLTSKDSEKASWLLVFDGVRDPSALNAFWPYDGPGSILITSRNPFEWTTSYQLVPFTVPEATRYLLQATKRDHQESQAAVQQVCEKLGGLPLALTQMAGIMTRQHLTFTEFANAYNRWEEQQRMLIEQPLPDLSSPWYGHNVASVWALENLRHGSVLLAVCSMMDPDGISENIFLETLGSVALSGFPQTKLEYEQARSELLESSILTREGASNKLFVHRLVQDVARMRLSTEQFRQVAMTCVKLISSLWKFEDFTWRHGTSRWAVCENLFPHVLKLRELQERYNIFPSADDWHGDFAFARLLVDAGWYHHERGRSAGAGWFYKTAKNICVTWVARLDSPAAQSEDSDVPLKLRKLKATMAEVLHNRGCIVTETNQPERALKYFTEFNAEMLHEFEASPGLESEDMRLAISYNELGNAHMLNGASEQGAKYFQLSIDTMRKRTNFSSEQVSLPLVNLGLTFWVQKRFEEALKLLFQGLGDRQDVFGVDDKTSFITGRYLHAIGNVLGSMSEYTQSLDFHRRALFQYKHTLGINHHRTADVFVKVAEHLLYNKQEENALALLDHALKAYGDQSTGDIDTSYTPERARAYFKRSKVLGVLRRKTEAAVDLETAISLRSQVVSSTEETRKLRDVDFDELVAFWSR